jgi:hypothetical protein
MAASLEILRETDRDDRLATSFVSAGLIARTDHHPQGECAVIGVM